MGKYNIVLTTIKEHAEELERKTRIALKNHRLSDTVDFEVDLIENTTFSYFFISDPSGKAIYHTKPGAHNFPFSLADEYIQRVINFIETDLRGYPRKSKF